MSNYIDQKISIKLLLRFALPSVLSMIFTSIYTSIDGMFVSRLILLFKFNVAIWCNKWF